MATYTTVQGDTWDTAALAAYGDELKAQALMQARKNIELLDYEVFPNGIVLDVPDVTDTDDEETESNLPDWRR
jgi:phage tail protein X